MKEPLTKLERSWILYDIGNSAFVLLVATILPVYFKHLAGSAEAFVEKMNQRAKELGMEDSHFLNPTGLPASGHVTSAYDIALMSRELILHHPDKSPCFSAVSCWAVSLVCCLAQPVTG